MGWFSNAMAKLQKWYDKIPVYEKPKKDTQGFERLFAPSTVASGSTKICCPESFDFEDDHQMEINRWQRRIDNAEVLGFEYEDPDKQVAAFERYISLFGEFREFCDLYVGGYTYWLDNYADEAERAERSLQNYLYNEYETVKAAYDEEQRAKRFISSIKKKIHTAVLRSENGLTRKEIYALFSEDDHDIVLKILNDLVKSGKVQKEKQGKRLMFVSKQKAARHIPPNGTNGVDS